MSFKYLSFVLNFNDPATVYAHSLISVHHDAMWYLILIISIVYWSLFKIIKDYNWSVFNKQLGFLLVLYRKPFFDMESFFIRNYIKVYFSFFSNLYFQFLEFVSYLAFESHFSGRGFLIYQAFLIKVYGFLEGFEHMVGKVNQLNYFQDKGVTFNIQNDILIDRYFETLLFNKLNSAFHFYNDVEKSERVLLTVQRFHHSTYFELVCATLPTIVILLILIPSTLLLYSLDEELEPLITYKVVGHQWFWSYEFNNWLNINGEWKRVSYNFDSCMLTEDNLELGSKRLLEVDKPLLVPVNVPLRFLITSGDVLHSWAVPELGIKIDAIPGRLSHYLVLIRRPGVFYGQCSELCGVAHAFMPIMIKAV